VIVRREMDLKLVRIEEDEVSRVSEECAASLMDADAIC